MGLAMVITGNGCSSRTSPPWSASSTSPTIARRDSGFTIFYMGINAGALIAPIADRLARQSTSSARRSMQNYKAVFIATGIGMLFSFLWFWFGRRQLGEIGRPPEGAGIGKMVMVLFGASVCAPVIYLLLISVAGPMARFSALASPKRSAVRCRRCWDRCSSSWRC